MMLAFVLAGAVALAATGAPPAWAGPAQEEYKLQLPDARGDGGSGSPSEARARLGGSSPSPSVASGSSLGGGSYPSDSSTGSQAGGSPDRTDGDSSSPYDDALLAKARADSGGSGLLSAGTSAASKAPAGLAVVAAVLLITLAGLLAVRRGRRGKGLSSS